MQALLSVSFGTSHADTRAKTIDAIDAELAAAFPERAFYAAWTSPRIVAKVRRERDEHHDLLDEAFARLSADGVDDLVVGTMCLLQGGEMRKIQDAARAWVAEGAQEGRARTARVAAPLLSNTDDRQAVARALADAFAHIASNEAVVLMGHGTPYGSNAVYDEIQSALDALAPGRFFVATVEGTPTLDDVIEPLRASGAARVYLSPLMIVAGDHAKNDLAGDDPDSWASRLRALGFEPEPVLKGLGEYAGVRELACAHALAAQPVEDCEAPAGE